MKLILRTLCGCEREIIKSDIIFNPMPDNIYVPLRADPTVKSLDVYPKQPVRRFQIWSHNIEQTVYQEVNL
jgi:hypothetical protein